MGTSLDARLRVWECVDILNPCLWSMDHDLPLSVGVIEGPFPMSVNPRYVL